MIIQICPHCGASTEWTESNPGRICSACEKPMFAEPDDANLPDGFNNMFETFGFQFVRIPQGDTPYSQAPADPDEFFRRLFEPEPMNARLAFRPDDTVKLKRPDLFGWIPVGAIGIIEGIEPPESQMAEKGRHYMVKFDLTPFKLPQPQFIIEWAKAQVDASGAPLVLPEYQESISQNFGVNDLELVNRGGNWNPAYEHPYKSDVMFPDFEYAPISSLTEYQIRQEKIQNHIREFFKDSARPTPNRRPVKVNYEGLQVWFAANFPRIEWAITAQTQIIQIGDVFNENDETWASLEIVDSAFNFSAPARFIIPE